MPCLSRFHSAAALAVFAPAVLALALLAPVRAPAQGQSVAAMVAEGEALRLRGLTFDAHDILSRAVEAAPDGPARAWAEAAYGLALAEAGRSGEAMDALESALGGAAGQPAVEAVASATLAILVAEDRPTETLSMRRRRLERAEELIAAGEAAAAGADPLVRGLVAARRARFALLGDDVGAARAAVADGLSALGAAASGGSEAAARIYLNLADAALGAGAEAEARAGYLAARAGGGRLAALAELGLGEAALAAGAATEALIHAEAARRLAADEAAEDVRFSADWLRAAAHRQAGQGAAARAAYSEAFDGLQRFRARTPLGAPPATSARRFADKRFQLDFIDFLLAPGAGSTDVALARDVVEDLKLDEIDDYFAERCTPARADPTPVEALGGGAAVLYPVVFDDRLEMIWAAAGRIGVERVEIDGDELRREVSRLRYLIDLRSDEAMAPAGRLYDLLIRPVTPALEAAGAKVIVVAPDGPLRRLPFAALWDGEAHLGRRYGLATVLGLGLLAEGEPPRASARVLAAGTAEAAQGYAPLPSVPQELASIAGLFDATVIEGDAFVAPALEAEIASTPYDIVHIATHAEFGATPSENFVVTRDGRLDVTRLEATMRARAVRTETPVGLLTLSACNTAASAGDRASLGLAGVGFRSGARSVLASLWPADDLATSALMSRFYQEIAAGVGRAEALRRAQVALMDDPATATPFQWANFMLIGDWR